MPLEKLARSRAASCEFRFKYLELKRGWQTVDVSPAVEEKRSPNPLVSSLDSIFEKVKTTQSMEVLTKQLNEFIGFELRLVPEVEYVFTAFRNGVFYVWVVVDRFEELVRRRIYDREKAIIDEFSMFEFDFYIVSRMGRDVHDLISESIELVYDRLRCG